MMMAPQEYKNTIVEVIKQAKLKHKPAPKGIYAYVVSAYVNSWGTQKLVVIDREGKEYCTTLFCVKACEDIDKAMFEDGLKRWIANTHVPVVFETKIVPHAPKKAIYCKFINKKQEYWVPISVIKNENCESVSLKDFKVDTCYSCFIPVWTAKKVGLVTPT